MVDKDAEGGTLYERVGKDRIYPGRRSYGDTLQLYELSYTRQYIVGILGDEDSPYTFTDQDEARDWVAAQLGMDTSLRGRVQVVDTIGNLPGQARVALDWGDVDLYQFVTGVYNDPAEDRLPKKLPVVRRVFKQRMIEKCGKPDRHGNRCLRAAVRPGGRCEIHEPKTSDAAKPAGF